MTETIHTTREIEALIPHRWPFLLVDRIVEYDAEAKRIVGIKGVTAGEWYFQGPFPGLPVLPGVIQIEAPAQTISAFQRRGSGPASVAEVVVLSGSVAVIGAPEGEMHYLWL